MRIEWLFLFRQSDARARSVRQYLIALLVIDQIGYHDLTEDLLVDGWIENRKKSLYSSVEIARHEVGGRNIDMRLGVRQIMTTAKAIDPSMFEKPADDRLDSYVFGQSLDAWPKAADTAHDKIYVYSGIACLI